MSSLCRFFIHCSWFLYIVMQERFFQGHYAKSHNVCPLQYPRVKCLPQSSANGQTKARDIRTSAHFELSQHDGMPCREFEPTTYLLLLLNCYPLHLTPFYIFILTSIYAIIFSVEFPLQADKWFSKVDRHF